MNQPILLRKYTVLQAEEAFDLYITATRTGTSIELDLAGTEDLHHVTFQPTTLLQNDELRLIGTTTEHQTINIVFDRHPNGTLTAQQALIVTRPHTQH